MAIRGLGTGVSSNELSEESCLPVALKSASERRHAGVPEDSEMTARKLRNDCTLSTETAARIGPNYAPAVAFVKSDLRNGAFI